MILDTSAMTFGINVAVGTVLVAVGTMFFGDFTRPVRRFLGMIGNVFNKKIEPSVFEMKNVSPIIDEYETVINV